MAEASKAVPSASTSFSQVRAFKSASNTTTPWKVDKALAALGTEGKGASIPAIVNWILSNYSIMDHRNLKLNVKKAILKGLTTGKIVRAPGCKDCVGAQGSFALPSSKAVVKKAKSYEKPTEDGANLVDQFKVKRKPIVVKIERKHGMKKSNSSNTGANSRLDLSDEF